MACIGGRGFTYCRIITVGKDKLARVKRSCPVQLVVKPGAALDLGKNAMSYVKG